MFLALDLGRRLAETVLFVAAIEFTAAVTKAVASRIVGDEGEVTAEDIAAAQAAHAAVGPILIPTATYEINVGTKANHCEFVIGSGLTELLNQDEEDEG